MDPRKRQTATATPAEPGGFPLGAHTVDLCRLCYGSLRLATGPTATRIARSISVVALCSFAACDDVMAFQLFGQPRGID